MPMQKPEAILFDLWGTLISSDAFDPNLGNAAILRASDNPHGVTLEEIQSLGGRVVSSLEGREDQSALEFTQASLLRIIEDAFDLRYRKTLLDMEWDFWQAALSVRLIDGVAQLLPLVAAKGIRMGVVSNSSFAAATLEKELDRHGIRRHFDFVVSSADYGVRKPDLIIFEVALRRLGLDASRTWFAGDNVGYDIIGAHSAGMFPVAFNPRKEIPPAVGEHAVISRWSELMPLLAAAA
jgi:putative hydrolase of the HAD superfamily